LLKELLRPGYTDAAAGSEVAAALEMGVHNLGKPNRRKRRCPSPTPLTS
jgi:hypothetical protein